MTALTANKATLEHNKELATIFKKMSDAYKYLGPEQRFRANAYAVAAQTLENMHEPVDALADDFKKLDALKGVGESIAEKIIEYLETGQIKAYEKLQHQVPFALLELMEIEGIGPATIRLLHDKLKVSDRSSLIAAIQAGKLEHLKGFAERKKENLLRVLKIDAVKERLPRGIAQPIAKEILQQVAHIKKVQQAAIAGSLRREKETIGDIDILLLAPRRSWKRIINSITRLPQVNRVLAAGETKVSLLYGAVPVQVDIRIVAPGEWGAALLYLTGSKEHNIQLRTMAREKGWKLNEYGVFEERTGKRIAGETEEGIYHLFHLPYIEPRNRLGKQELSKEH
jgi:DNA polymerase (family 10)